MFEMSALRCVTSVWIITPICSFANLWQDWHADNPATNYWQAYNSLRSQGYFVEIIGRRWSPSTLSADAFGALLLVDPERKFDVLERQHLAREVDRGLSVVIFADWYHEPTMERIRFFDENTREWWTPVTGGANVIELNLLLQHWNITLDTSRVLAGFYGLLGAPALRARFASGAAIASFPSGEIGGRVAYAHGLATEVVEQQGNVGVGSKSKPVPILGFYSTAAAKTPGGGNGGRIVVYGDSNCIDASHLNGACWWLLEAALAFATRGEIGDIVDRALVPWRGSGR